MILTSTQIGTKSSTTPASLKGKWLNDDGGSQGGIAEIICCRFINEQGDHVASRQLFAQ